jgi:hypothetical protein
VLWRVQNVMAGLRPSALKGLRLTVVLTALASGWMLASTMRFVAVSSILTLLHPVTGSPKLSPSRVGMPAELDLSLFWRWESFCSNQQVAS